MCPIIWVQDEGRRVANGRFMRCRWLLLPVFLAALVVVCRSAVPAQDAAPAAFQQVAFSPDGRLLVAAREDGSIHVWRVADWRPLAVLKPPAGTQAGGMALSPRGSRLAAGYEGGPVLWDYATGKRITRLEGGDCGSPVYSPDGRFIAAYTFQGTYLWSAGSGKLLGLLQGPTGFSHPLVFSPDSRFLAAVEMRDTVVLWDVRTRRPSLRLPSAGGGLLAFRPDGRMLVTGEPGGQTRQWKLPSGHPGPALAGRLAAVVRSAAFSPTGRWLAVGDINARTVVCDVRSNRLLRTMDGFGEQVAFTAAGDILAGLADFTQVTLCLAGSWKPRARLRQAKQGEAAIMGFSLSSSGRLLATAGRAGSPSHAVIKIWRIPQGEPVQSLQGR